MTRILHIGLGQIGRDVVRALIRRNHDLQLVGVVDNAPELAGKNVADILDLPAAPTLQVRASIQQALEQCEKPQVAVVTTSSRLEILRPMLEFLLDAGISVVSSCEELAWPMLRHPEISRALDLRAKAHGAALLGTGVNPGFAMDAFPLIFSAAGVAVKTITITRSLDAAKRRPQLQKKVAAGFTVAEFTKAKAARQIGHVGLAESVAMLAAGLGWKLEQVDERFEPVLAEQPITTEHFAIQPGQLRGMNMIAKGILNGVPRITLDLTMAFQAATFDAIKIEGEPNLEMKVTTGFPGDACTTALLVNCAAAVQSLAPGMRTMLDLVNVRGNGI